MGMLHGCSRVRTHDRTSPILWAFGNLLSSNEVYLITMEAYASPNHQYAQNQLRNFVSLEDDDEMTQLILEELAMPRRSSFVNVIATMAASPSSKSENGLNAIVEEDQSADE